MIFLYWAQFLFYAFMSFAVVRLTDPKWMKFKNNDKV